MSRDSATLLAPVAAAPGAAATSVAWRAGGRINVTVIVKASFAFAQESVMARVEPQGILTSEVHHGNNPTRSIRFTGDLAPYLPNVDVLFTGKAHAPPGALTTSSVVRLGVYDGTRWLLDKALTVRSATPFHELAIGYERAFGGLESRDNPLGVGADAGSGEPNIIDPIDPRRPAGFGPIGRAWPQRKALLGATPRKALEGPIAEIPDGFDWSYFQAAPEDQRLSNLRCDEWIVLEGLHRAWPRLRTRLPGARGLSRIHGISPLDPEAGRPLELRADTLRIDGAEERCTVVWRASFPVVDEAALAAVWIEAGVEIEGEAIAWPGRRALVRDIENAGGDADVPAPDVSSTMTLDDDDFEVVSRSGGTPALAPEAVAPPPETTRLAARTLALAPEEQEAAQQRPALPFRAGESALTVALGSPWARAARASRARDDGASALETTVDLAPEPEAPTERFAAPSGPEAPPAEPLVGAPRPEPARPTRATVAGRRSSAIPIITRSPLIGFTLPWQLRPPRESRTVVVKGTFDIVPNGAAAPRSEPEFPSGDVHADGEMRRSLLYPSDFALFKPKADVVLKGHAYAPGGSAQSSVARFRFGRARKGFDRTIAVFGDRYWEPALGGMAQTEARRFHRMPLVHERAYGGPGFDDNPVGTGRHGRDATPDGRVKLPNLEDPSRLVRSPDDTPGPMCFGAIPMLWQSRWSKLGTYDARWQKARWPYFPEDFDWACFQAAPAEQQVDAIEGDEPYEILGMHPQHAAILGRLPGLRVRCFAELIPQIGGFHEVVMRLDTAVFDVDEMKLNLVWRGVLEASDDEASEIAALFVLGEEIGARPATIDEARASLIAARTPLEPVAERPDGETAPANENAATGSDDDEGPPTEAEASAAEQIAGLRAKAAAAGMPADALDGLIDAVGDAGTPAPPKPVASADDMAARLRAGRMAEEQIAELRDAMTPEPEEEPEDEPPPAAPSEAAALRREDVVAMLAAGASFDGADLGGVDLVGLDLTGRSFAGANLKEARLAQGSLAGANLVGAQIGGADLTGANLERANLEGADMYGANLAGARLAKANVAFADLGGVRAAGADFTGIEGAKARFAEAVLTGASFAGAALEGADFSAASLDGACFDDASIAEIRLYDAVGEGASFERAQMSNARADGVRLTYGSLKQASADGSIWEGAVLDGSTFHGASLVGASFVKAACVGVTFSAADLTGARLRRAQLGGASLLKTNLMKASLEAADLSSADLRGANLYAAETWKAKLDGARLDFALVGRTKLVEPT